MILAPDGVTDYAVYHGYDSGRPGRKVCLDPLRWCGDRPVIGTGASPGHPTETPQPIPPCPVYDAEDEYALGQLLVEGGGAEDVVVHAGPSGAHVTDLTVTAR